MIATEKKTVTGHIKRNSAYAFLSVCMCFPQQLCCCCCELHFCIPHSFVLDVDVSICTTKIIYIVCGLTQSRVCGVYT